MSSFRVRGELSLDGSRFSAGLNRAQGAANRFATGIRSSLGSRLAGLFAVGAMGAFARNTIRSADALYAQARRMGTSIEQTQILARAAEDAGGSVESLTMAFEYLSQYQQRALSGGRGKRYMELFQAMGVTAEQLKTMRAAELFGGPIKQWAGGASQEQAVSILRQLMGSQGGIIAQVLKQDLDALGEEMAGLGSIMSEETVVKLKRLNDFLEIAGKSLTASFAPAVLEATGALIRWGLSLGKWVTGRASGFAAAGEGMTVGQQIKAWWAVARAEFYGNLSVWTGSRTEEQMEAYKEGVAEAAGLNMEAAGVAQIAAEEPFDKAIKQLGAVAALLAGLGEGAPPIPGVEQTKAVRGRAIQSDALIAVGGFLGQGRAGSINRIAQQQLQVQEQIRDKIQVLIDQGSDEGFSGNE